MDELGVVRMVPVAVIGLSCRFPGAVNQTQFWANLVAGTVSVDLVPEGRWADHLEAHSSNTRSTIRFGGFIKDAESFDAAFFGVTRREAQYMDPQQRILLELAWECLEDASIRVEEIQSARWGVFVGAGADDFRHQYIMAGSLDRFGHMGTSRCMLANRLSHYFRLCGPSEVIDSGQSSSLAALHRAISSLRLGECEAAVVGGINLNLLREVTDQVQLWGGLSPDGRSYTFDERANGYVRGEGGGCVILKPLDAAVRDGDNVYCVIRGSAANNDGGMAGLGVPSEDGQRQVMTAAYVAAGASPADVAYIELHGTGTPVGDPIEARAIGAVVGRARPHGDPVLVGSVKTNIGHLESAAGIAGLIKVCLMLHHGAVPPSLNFIKSPASIPLDELNIRIITEARERPFEEGDLLGVSSFGMGGTNVHVVMGPPPPELVRTRGAESGNCVWCLSGRSRQAVREMARSLLGHPFRPALFSIADVAWTLARRTQWDQRAAVVGSDWEQIRRGLEKVASGNDFAVPERWLKDAALARSRLVQLAGEYVYTGGVAALRALMEERQSKVPALPTYPFERESFAIPHAVAAADPPAPPAQSPATSFAGQWSDARTDMDRIWLVRTMLERELTAILGGSAPALAPDIPFNEIGIDSMTLLEFLDRINEVTSLNIQDTALFNYPTINELAACVNEEMESGHGREQDHAR